jgi:hypothetical protein
LFIDHDNRYGRMAVRGLLCVLCNLRLGRIDAGNEPHDGRTVEYYENAWFKQHFQDPGEDYTPVQFGMRRPFTLLWRRLRQARPADCDQVVAELLQWYFRCGELPERPAERDYSGEITPRMRTYWEPARRR